MYNPQKQNIINTPIIPSYTNYINVVITQPIIQHLYNCTSTIVSPVLLQTTGDCGCGYGEYCELNYNPKTHITIGILQNVFNILFTPIILPCKMKYANDYYKSYDNRIYNELCKKYPKKQIKVIDNDDKKTHTFARQYFHKRDFGKYACFYVDKENIYELKGNDIYGTYVGNRKEIFDFKRND
jgi:hypothetical protein